MNGHPTRDGWFGGSDTPCVPVPPRCDRIYRLILLGPPGVGKGTQAQLLCDRLRTCHLSTGDLFRAASCDAHPSPAISAALEAMRRGELVSDELVMSMVRERSGCLKCHGGFLLDGVPRTLDQARALEVLLDELEVELNGVLSYELPLEQIVDRLGGRRTCLECRAICHLSACPPAVDGICDYCGGALMQRDDDRPEAVRVRMAAYRAATQPLTDFYDERGKLVSVSAEGSPREIVLRTLQALGSGRVIQD